MSNATPFCDTHSWMCPTVCIMPLGPFMVQFEAQWPVCRQCAASSWAVTKARYGQ